MKKTFLSLLFLVHTTVFAQIAITFPINRAVFQRNLSNGGVIPIGGTFQAQLDRIDARLTPINGGNSVDWTTIVQNPTYGSFNGVMYAMAGWYKLEIRGVRNGNVICNSILDKVGMGEVLIISGQSNAQGYEGRGNPSATDDRVNCITNLFEYEISEPPFPIISQLTENVKIAPLGKGSWCWGKLGDLLAKKLNCPILFINTAYEAMGVEDWSRSADGERGVNFYSGSVAAPGYPFELMKKSLHYYINLFGIRSILWHQGETDSDRKTSTQKYKDALQYVIGRSRGETGKNISWMICRASRVKTGTFQPVIDAQNLVIQNNYNVFAGPDTDLLTDRPDGVHFENNSLIQLAEAWNDKLDNNFFAKSSPFPASSPLFFYTNCNVDNKEKPIKISMPDGFKEYYWTNGFVDLTKSAALETNLGYFRGRAVDYLGNVFFTPAVNFTNLSLPEKPNVIVEGATSFCEGGSVRLSASTNQNIRWNNGEQNQSIVISQGGSFSVSQYNYLGCAATSNSILVSVLPKPDANISADGATIFCADKAINLRSNASYGNSWNTGENKQTITINKSGDYFVKVKNEFGCENTSSKIKITVNALPEKPIVSTDGPTVFCADKSIKLASNVSKDITWNTGDKSSNLIINRTGDYFVTAKNEFGCQNISNTIPVKVNPLPQKPTIIASGPTTFCDGESVTLTSSVNQNNIWNNAKTTNAQIVKTSGIFSVKVIDQNGCISPISDETSITVKPTPLAVEVLQSGTYTLESVSIGFYNLKYEWLKDGKLLGKDSYLIKAREAGNYSVRGSISYQLQDGKTLRCFSPLSKPYNFLIDSANQGISLFPNPSPNGIINLETLDDYENTTLSVYDLRGFLLKDIAIPKIDSKKTIDLKDLPKGTYLLGLRTLELNIIKRVFIE